MSLRDQLINTEIQHHGQMLQLLSYELTLLQDFIKEKFGSDYEAFRKNLTDEQPNPASFSSASSPPKPSTSSKSVNVTARKSTAPRPGGFKRERSDSNWENTDEVEEKRHRKDSDQSEEEDGMHLQTASGMSDCEESNSAIDDGADNDDNEFEMEFPVDQKNIQLLMDQEQVETGERLDFSQQQSRGKPRKQIWNKFTVTKLPNGKLHVRCPICKESVSNKSSRMEKHYQKCRLLEVPSELSRPSSKNLSLAVEKRETLKAMRELKKEKNLRVVSGVSAYESREEGGGGPLGPGRRLDPVWAYFNVADDPTTRNKVAICKRCQIRVSSRVHRVRRHFIICHELDKEIEEVEGQGT